MRCSLYGIDVTYVEEKLEDDPCNLNNHEM